MTGGLIITSGGGMGVREGGGKRGRKNERDAAPVIPARRPVYSTDCWTGRQSRGRAGVRSIGIDLDALVLALGVHLQGGVVIFGFHLGLAADHLHAKQRGHQGNQNASLHNSSQRVERTGES